MKNHSPSFQLVRVLGPDWQSMDYAQIAARAHSLGQAARLTHALAAYMDETESATVADALETLSRGTPEALASPAAAYQGS